jgi:putative ABC transport system permease protein
MLSDLIFRARSLFRRNAVEVELSDELEFHLSRQVEKYVRSGMSEPEARRRARIEFGGMEQVKEECRQARGVEFILGFCLDMRYGFRLLRKSPGFALAALLTLGLAAGANTAIFSIVYGTLLRPLPYRDSSRLVVLNETTAALGSVSVSYPNFLDWRAQSRTFSGMAAVHSLEFSMAGAGEPENVSGLAVSSNLLSLLGTRPLIGRDFSKSEDEAGTAPVVLLSYPLWQSHFGGNPNALGRSIDLNGESFTVVGVLPPDFRWQEKADVVEPAGIWVSRDAAEVQERGSRGDTMVIGRLAPGATLRQARVEMEGIAARLARAYPGSNNQFGAELQAIRDVMAGDIRTAVLVLFAAVVFVLLIACANVVNLFLMRGAARGREMALRVAVGASRVRLVRQLLAESFVLAGLGGALGLVLAAVGIRGLEKLIPSDSLTGAALGLNLWVFAFLCGVVVLSTFLFGIIPALHSSRPNLQAELKDGGRGASSGAKQGRLRNILATAEVALALVLLVGAGLMIQSLYRLLAVNPGFHAERVLTLRISLRTEQYAKDAAARSFWEGALQRVRVLPGVTSVALGLVVPFTGDHSRADITVEGMELPQPGRFPHPDVHVVSARYAETLGIPLLQGRVFRDSDDENAPHVGMINAQLARRYFEGRDPIGKRFMFGHPSANREPKWITIVGVLGDTRLYGLANPARLEVYVPYRQDSVRDMTLMVKSAGDPQLLTNSIRAAIASLDRGQPVFDIATVDQLIDRSISTRRVALVLLGQFGLLALILAGIGIYGVIAYSVAQRTHEIGIRLALGADRRGILRMVFAQGTQIAATGIAIGIAASLMLTTWMRSMLYSVGARDPLTLIGVAAVLALTAMAACYVPARRALRVDPVVALRNE